MTHDDGREYEYPSLPQHTQLLPCIQEARRRSAIRLLDGFARASHSIASSPSRALGTVNVPKVDHGFASRPTNSTASYLYGEYSNSRLAVGGSRSAERTRDIKMRASSEMVCCRKASKVRIWSRESSLQPATRATQAAEQHSLTFDKLRSGAHHAFHSITPLRSCVHILN